MGSKRYNNSKLYEKFVSYANVGDKLLRRYVEEILLESDIKDVQSLHTLNYYLNSNAFLSTIYPPFKYKNKYQVLHNNLKRKVPINKRGQAIRGDIVEVYLYWLKVNYGDAAAKSYLENKIINICNERESILHR